MISAPLLWRRARLALTIGFAASLATPVLALSFNVGEVEGQFDTALSVDASWATASPSRRLIGSANGGSGDAATADDGRLNFSQGKTFSKRFNGLHGLELRYGDSGLFLRGRYWYDFELKDENPRFKAIDDAGRQRAAQSSGAELLDAFVYHNYTLADQPGSVRLGKQVVSWGQGVFIGGGIDSINPSEAALVRRPGAEVKDGLRPVNMFYVSQNLTDHLAAEAFYQLEWDQDVAENCGTFFSTSDVLAEGCRGNLRVLDTPAGLSGSALSTLTAAGVQVDREGVLVRRGADRDARDGGQFGVALHYDYVPLDTEFGGYFMNYHSRAPMFSAHSAASGAYASAAQAQALGPEILAGNSSYYLDYPEDIQLYGLSFSTTLASGTAWRGELSYRPNAPVALNGGDVLNALTGTPATLTAAPDQDVKGYRRKEITQLQTSLTQYFDQVMGADRLTLVGEVGLTHVGGLESRSRLRYGRAAVYGPGQSSSAQDGCAAALGSADYDRHCGGEGFTTSTSWGYRARAVWDYNSFLPGIDLRPSVAWSHDVAGYSPGPNGNFEQGRKAVSLGLDAEYEDTYTASLSYTNFFGGRYSQLEDRDYVSLGFGVHF